MKKTIIIAACCVAITIITVVIVRQKSFLPPTVMGEHFAPQLITDEAWRESIADDPTAHACQKQTANKPWVDNLPPRPKLEIES